MRKIRKIGVLRKSIVKLLFCLRLKKETMKLFI